MNRAESYLPNQGRGPGETSRPPEWTDVLILGGIAFLLLLLAPPPRKSTPPPPTKKERRRFTRAERLELYDLQLREDCNERK